MECLLVNVANGYSLAPNDRRAPFL
jgi:hypothetical protein